jgi:hypothetical protein
MTAFPCFPKSHYDWLDENLKSFYEKLNIPFVGDGGVTANGDKCYQYRSDWFKAGIPFPHGVAIYMLTYESPFYKEVRSTSEGWVDPSKWVIDNYKRFKLFLNPVSREYER